MSIGIQENTQNGRVCIFRNNGTKSFEGILVNGLRKGKGV